MSFYDPWNIAIEYFAPGAKNNLLLCLYLFNDNAAIIFPISGHTHYSLLLYSTNPDFPHHLTKQYNVARGVR